MDARSLCAAVWAACMLTICQLSADAASFRTQNFIVSARDPQFARQVCEAAEQYRTELAYEWLGRELPPWPQPCPITVQDGPQLGAGGATSFSFDRGQPFGWTMNIQGTRERILDSVLPHEVTHTVFATHFGQPVPRWADEGACTTVEHSSERAKQHQLLLQFLTTNRGIPFNKMFRLTEYPRDIMPLYSQGHSVAQFLVAQGGRRQFVEFVGRGMAGHNWDAAVEEFYGFTDLSDLQLTWVDWVRQGCPEVEPRMQQIAQNQPPAQPTGTTQLASTGTRWQRNPHGNQPPLKEDRPAGPSAVLASARPQSWYARQREQATSDKQLAFGPPSVTASRSTAARTQDLEQVQERVLQWSASPHPAAPVDGMARNPAGPQWR